jgi:hypothetical protein
MKPTPKEAKKIHDHYDRVVEHLVAEGYAINNSSADKIISGMSDEWYNLIISE